MKLDVSGLESQIESRLMQERSFVVVYPLIPMLCCAAISIGNLFLNVFEFPYYADYSWVSHFITDSTPAPRWLIHLKLQTAIFHTLESMYFVRAFMPGFLHDPLSLARALNVAFLVAAGIHCFAFYPRLRGTTSWVITSAAYCFMATGYGKVYGAATAVLLMLYCALAESEFEGDGVLLGVVSALVGLYYLALMPIAFAILLTVLIKRPQAFLPALLSFILAGYILIATFSGPSIPSYFQSLWAESHFGDQFTDYVPYRRQAFSGNSVFFKLSFIFSAKHLGDKLYMLFFSGALLGLGGACYEAVRFLFGGPGLVKRFAGMKPMVFFCFLSVGACLVIVLGYLSKIGPRGDLPFYSPCIVPFTFLWLQLRRLRCADDLSSRFVLIGQYAYTAVIVVWSGVVGPPEI
jgi:hypothetical protein